MVRRHSLPPHALKRQNSRFKIGAGVAAAAEGRGDPRCLGYRVDRHDDATRSFP